MPGSGGGFLPIGAAVWGGGCLIGGCRCLEPAGEVVVIVGAAVWLVGLLAQIEAPTPSNEGLPGAAMWSKMLGWLAWCGLAGSMASLFIGGAVWGLAHASGNSMQASRGKTFALGGVAGAIITGLAPTIVNQLSAATAG